MHDWTADSRRQVRPRAAACTTAAAHERLATCAASAIAARDGGPGCGDSVGRLMESASTALEDAQRIASASILRMKNVELENAAA